MFADQFTTIEHGAAAEILDVLNPLLEGAPFDPSMARILSHTLPFYPGYSLIEVSDYDVNPPRQVSFLYNKEQTDSPVLLLSGTNEPIYKLNSLLSVTLNEKMIIPYIRFFFTYVRGSFGRFLVVENVDEINWREEPAPAGRKALGKLIMPLTLISKPEDEFFVLKASIVFKDSLFESDIKVLKDGTVTLSNQEIVVENIPVMDDHFGQ